MIEKKTLKRKKKYVYFIGIDVSKNKLDYAVIRHKEFLFHRLAENNKESILAFIDELKVLPNFRIATTIFCMEQTGIYTNILLFTLRKLKANICVENPVVIKNSIGLVRGKNDKIDSIRIVQYTQKNHETLKFWVPPRAIILKLKHLLSIRVRLLTTAVALKAPLKEELLFLDKKTQQYNIITCRKSIQAIEEDLVNVDKTLDEQVDSDIRLSRLRELIISVPGIGRITAIHLIVFTNEFIDFTDPKKFACYAGVVPFKKESGEILSKGRISHFANKTIKSLLHLCALSAVRSDKELKAYFERKKTGEGKRPIAVINAVRNKLILRVFACVKQDRFFIKDYERAMCVEGNR